MSHVMSLIKRDTKIFYRTKGNIFFSLLAILILVALHFAIFRTMYTDNWVQIAAQIPGLSAERLQLQWIADSLVFAAIIPIGTVTLSLTALGLMVADRETNALSDFLVSPIRRNSLLASYLLSSFFVGFVMLLGFVVFFHIYFLIVYGVGFTLLQIGLILLGTIGSLIFGNVFMLLLVSFLKTEQTLSAVGAVVGTFIGFLAGAYIPLGMFGETVGTVFSALPFAQLTILVRGAFLQTLETVTPLTHEMISGEIARGFGIELWLGDRLIPLWGAALMAGGITLILFLCLIIRFAKMKKAD
ncbi:MAG: ABC transporter permease [Oscillospiraceae bacterium]|nr:ABC transporter permease [Oscillospiraceae bacterium]